MISVEDIREIDFSTSMSGYKKAEVDDFLDEVALDYEKLQKQVKTLEEQLSNNGPAPIIEAKPVQEDNTTETVTGILESAQRFSEQLISEAKQKAEEILTAAALKAKELEDKIATDKQNHEQLVLNLKAQVEAEAADKLKAAAEKSESIIIAAKDSVARQQLLFDKLRVEADNFKSKLLDSYKKQLELLNEFPTQVPLEVKKHVEAVKAAEQADEVEKVEETQPEPTVEETENVNVSTEANVNEVPQEDSDDLEDNAFFKGLKSE